MNARDLVKQSEGLRYKAYRDSRGVWTIGYGHTKGVAEGDTCTKEQAELWLDADLASAFMLIDQVVSSPLTTQQRDALASFVFNVGPGLKGDNDGFLVLKSGKPSTILLKLNAGDMFGAADELLKWTRAGSTHPAGLVVRRKRERALFLSGTDINPDPIPTQEDNDMAPFLMAAIPALIQELPNFAKIFQNKDVAERNVEAVTKAADIIVKSVPGASNLQDAVEKIQTDPEAKDAANEAVKMSTADLLDVIERVSAIDQKSIDSARVFNAGEPLMINSKRIQMKFWHVLALFVTVAFLVAVVVVAVKSTNEGERMMMFQALIGSYLLIMGFVFGSSTGSKVKDFMRGGPQP